MKVDWHGAELTRATVIDRHYRHTQNVRRFMLAACGEAFRFDRDLMVWIRSGVPRPWAMWWMNGAVGNALDSVFLPLITR